MTTFDPPAPSNPAGVKHKGDAKTARVFAKFAIKVVAAEPLKKPNWIRVRAPSSPRFYAMKKILREKLTENAAKRIAELKVQENVPTAYLRLAVSGGGCSGFQYGFTFDDQRQEDDTLFEREGVGLVIDTTSLELVDGAEIDFVEDLMGASFQVRNPNASSSCGCGKSFAMG